MVISIVLVRPQNEGNVGAVARVMKNFGFSRLVLVSPACNHLGVESRTRAKHAQNVLDDALVVSSLTVVPCDWLVATSAQLGSDYNVPRIPLSPRELAVRLNEVDAHVGIVFGPEDDGLSNDEVMTCDLFVHIPTSPSYPVLNLSHGVGIVCYELFQCVPSSRQYAAITKEDKRVLYTYLDSCLDLLEFSTSQKRATQKKILHRLVGRSLPTRREAFALMGLFKKVGKVSQVPPVSLQEELLK